MAKMDDHMTKQEVLELMLDLVHRAKGSRVWINSAGNVARDDCTIDFDLFETAIREEMDL